MDRRDAGQGRGTSAGAAARRPRTDVGNEKETEKEKEKAGVLNPEIGLEKNEQRATIGVGSQQRVWVLQADGTLKPVDVVTGQSDGRLTAVTAKGLRPGMKVVTGKGATGQ